MACLKHRCYRICCFFLWVLVFICAVTDFVMEDWLLGCICISFFGIAIDSLLDIAENTEQQNLVVKKDT